MPNQSVTSSDQEKEKSTINSAMGWKFSWGVSVSNKIQQSVGEKKEEEGKTCKLEIRSKVFFIRDQFSCRGFRN